MDTKTRNWTIIGTGGVVGAGGVAAAKILCRPSTPLFHSSFTPSAALL